MFAQRKVIQFKNVAVKWSVSKNYSIEIHLLKVYEDLKEVTTMLPRWDTRHTNIKCFLSSIITLCPEIIKTKKSRGRPPKHPIKHYAALIAVKEEEKASLRKAEADYSEEICSERVDHSVIHYWEKKLKEVYVALVIRIGQLLCKLTRPKFKIIDSTKFATWKQKEIEFHTLTAITRKTVFPVSVFFGSVSPSKAVRSVLTKTEGRRELIADRLMIINL